MTHLGEEELILYYYGEGDGSPAVRAHLDACEACRAEYSSLQRVLNVVDTAPVPERGAEYGAHVWHRLEGSLGARRRWVGPLLWPARHWAAVAGMVALVAAAFLAGRYYPGAHPATQMAAGQVRERVLLVAVGDHLERSQMVLIELMNAPPDRPLNVSFERGRAEDLASANRLYRQTAARTGDARVANVLDELEPLLVEIAHSPSELTADELTDLQRRIQAEGILFKVRVLGSTVRAQERRTASVGGNTL
jgi:hypothetical protein